VKESSKHEVGEAGKPKAYGSFHIRLELSLLSYDSCHLIMKSRLSREHFLFLKVHGMLLVILSFFWERKNYDLWADSSKYLSTILTYHT
jgi:hypothetical protein